MRVNRQLLIMAGVMETPQDRALKRHIRQIAKGQRVLQKEAFLVDMISRRERSEGGTAPMPYQKMQETLAKMAKGEL